MSTPPQRTDGSLGPLQSAGPGVDAHGLPVVDPTKNVIQLVEATVKRLDDLREANRDYNLARLDAAKDYQALSQQRQDDLRESENKRITDMMALTSKYEELLRLAETNRINAIRTVDVNAVAEAARVSAAQALTLATQVATSAETLRTQVGTVATATATALANALEPLQKAIEDLRKTQYAQQGEKAAKGDNQQSSQWLVALIVSVVLAAAALGVTVIIAMHK